MEIPDIRFWAGTEESFNSYLVALKTASGLDIKAYMDDDEEDEAAPRLLTKQGNVGVVSIRGPLVPSAPWYARYTGITGYDEIRSALIAAANDPDIGAVLLDINSGGGAVAGVTDVADLVGMIDAKVKPVHTYSDGMIASAALWVGASARDLQIGKVTEAGSIGVLTVLKSMSRYYKEMGIDAEVLRSAEFKAMGHPLDPITDKAKAEIMDQLMQMDAMFNEHMADARGTTVELATEKFGKGRVFIGQRAVEVGLADAVSTFDAVISSLQGAIDSQKQRSQYGANSLKGPVVKAALTEQHVAALAEGMPLQTGAAATTETPEVPAAPAAVAPEATPAPAASAEQTPAPAPAPAASSADVVTFLQGQLATAQAQNLELNVQVRALTAAAETSAGVMASMRSLVVASVDRLQVAMGQSAGASAGLDDASLLAMHASLRSSFETKFKAGGVAAVSSSGSSESREVVTDSVRARRMNATKPA
ncbi:MAG: S49 family peptidase [Armatimonadia bacterium]